jgi:hypothetical protein
MAQFETFTFVLLAAFVPLARDDDLVAVLLAPTEIALLCPWQRRRLGAWGGRCGGGGGGELDGCCGALDLAIATKMRFRSPGRVIFIASRSCPSISRTTSRVRNPFKRRVERRSVILWSTSHTTRSDGASSQSMTARQRKSKNRQVTLVLQKKRRHKKFSNFVRNEGEHHVYGFVQIGITNDCTTHNRFLCFSGS